MFPLLFFCCFSLPLVLERTPPSTLFEGVCLTGCQSCQATLSHKHVTATSNIERPTPLPPPTHPPPPTTTTPSTRLTEATHNPPPPRDSERNKQNRDKRRPNSCMSLGGGGAGGAGGGGGLKKIIQLFESNYPPPSPPPPQKKWGGSEATSNQQLLSHLTPHFSPWVWTDIRIHEDFQPARCRSPLLPNVALLYMVDRSGVA